MIATLLLIMAISIIWLGSKIAEEIHKITCFIMGSILFVWALSYTILPIQLFMELTIIINIMDVKFKFLDGEKISR